MNDFDSSVDVLVRNYKQQAAEQRVEGAGSPAKIAELLGQWLKTVSLKDIEGTEGIDVSVANQLKAIKKSNIGSEVGEEMRKAIRDTFGEGDFLKDIFRKTYAQAEAKRELQREGLVKTLALPAAQTTKRGDVSFQTIHGAQRALPKFVKYETGFEVLHKTLEEMKKFEKAASFQGRIREIGIRPEAGSKKAAEQLSKDMFEAIIESSESKGEGLTRVMGAFRKAAPIKGLELERTGQVGSVKGFQSAVEGSIDAFKKLSTEQRTFDEFAKRMKSLNLSAYDAVRNISAITSKNVYDIIGDVLKGDKTVSPITQVAKEPGYERSVRDFEKAIRDIEGMMPLIEGNRPRRGYHQENVVNLLTRTSSIYGGDPKKDRLTPDQQKKLIKDINIELNYILKGREATGQALPYGIRRATSLGIPEAQAGKIEEFRPRGGTGDSKFLKTLNATSVKLYAEDLTSLAPFQQFQQAGRNIANVTNAMANLDAVIETPKVRSEKERAVIESGRYGRRGYGYNVVAELRNTAANFEDQIVIAGKLSQALTKSVSILVKPGPTGRVRGASSEERIKGTGVTEIKLGDVRKVANEYMKILGVPETYKGRADIAEIKGMEGLKNEVEKTISVVRGENVEVQRAKLAETFLNYFGRKLTTRYGSKGVSITPTQQIGGLGKIIQSEFGKKIKVDPTASLGYQRAPKSLGKMASELFSLKGGKDVSEDLKNRLKESGNKFLIDMFHDVNIVATDEAIKTKKLYEEFAARWQEVFKSEVPTPGVAGIKAVRGAYTKTFGEERAFDIKPIDVRISSYGAAKRGLQTEFMESIFSNIAGVGEKGATTLKQLQKTDYERLLGKGDARGTLSKYSEALGYRGAGKTQEQLGPELFKMFGGKGDFAEQLAAGDEKAVLAKKAAALEAASTFYSSIIDEFGKRRTGFVGEKFLQIIEEPTENPEWQRGQIERGQKGARLNLPAFSAYATVFGEQSAFMGEIQKSLDVNAKKHWEYLKALQTIQGQDTKIYQNLTRDLKTVDIGQLDPFDLATGVYGKKRMTDEAGNEVVNPRSFSGTVLDIEKYPEAFKLSIPTGKYGKTGEPQKEDFYVPGALARGTYPEPLIAGERGMDQVTRRLTHVVNMARQLSDVMAAPEEFLNTNKVKNKITPMVGSWIDSAWSLAKKQGPEAEAQIEAIFSRITSALSTTMAPSPALIQTGGASEYHYAMGFRQRQLSKAEAGYTVPGKTKPMTRTEALASAVSTAGDVLIGKSGKGASPEQMAAPTGISRALDAGTIGAVAQKLGINVLQDEIDTRVASLQKAKIDYYSTLAETATGKTGTINELLFSRKIPAVMGKAITAVVDKRDDIKVFQKRLESIGMKYGENFETQTTQLVDVAKEHGKTISGYKKIGIPFLKQEEIGVPESFASKIPLEFIKKFSVDMKAKTVAKQEQEKITGTLLDLLKYTQRLSKFAGGEGSEAISKYIEDELVPYVESIRFPFTGTSSITPFKPKLIEEGAFGGLAKNALIVPGAPEGLEGLAPIIEEIDNRIKSLSAQREVLQTQGGPQNEIDRLTSLIRELNAAVSDVIPKYVAQAQKLDFDGDQIEIHAATTAKARKDIEKHFKRFHEASSGGAVRTQDVFMKRFLSEAAKVKTTGEYVFGESAGAFEKKFPSGKGFEFMKSPFLTEGLEYMDPTEALGVLQGNKQVGGAANVIRDIFKDLERPEEEVARVIEEIGTMDKEDPEVYVRNIMNLIQSSYGSILKQVQEGIKKRLYEEKMGDTIEAQLFKIHTGPETEAMYRVHRLAETSAGFGGGLISGERKSTPYFKERFPDVKAMGGNPEEEFHTMMNEVLRFGIQKGMDVKHAGEKPVAGEMLSYLTRGVTGATELWDRVNDESDKTFSELRDFSTDSASAIKMRLGELSSSDILKEAKTIAGSRGGEVTGLDSKTRKELIDIIIEQVGFKGFLTELSLLIKKEAIDGLVKQAEGWTAGKKADPGGGLPPVRGAIRDWAEKAIADQMGSGGINVRQTITEAQSPLYGSRTFFASPAAEYNKYRGKVGEVAVPEQMLSGMEEKDRKSYATKYKTAVATASNIQQELKSFTGSKQTGAYADMIRGTIDALYEQQSEIERHATSLLKEGYDSKTARKADLADRIISRKGVSSFANTIISMQDGMKGEVERLSDLAGVPGLSDTELFDIQEKTSKKFKDLEKQKLTAAGQDPKEFETDITKFIDDSVAKAQALIQLDRVSEVLLSRRHEGMVLQDIAPRDLPTGTSFAENRRNVMQEARSRIKQENERRGMNISATMARAGEPPAGGAGGVGMMGMGGAGGVVPVHIVSADAGVTINVRGLEGAAFTQAGPSSDPADRLMRLNEELIQFADNAVKLKETIKQTKPTYKPGLATSYERYFSPSKLAGGGEAYGGGEKPAFTEEQRLKEQLERLVKGMTTRADLPRTSRALADWGSAIHAKFEKILEKQGNIDVERYAEFNDDVGGIIGGFADIIEYEDDKKEKVIKVADVKTVGPAKLKAIKSAIDKAGTSDFSEIVKNVDDDMKRQLNDYFSQLNAYLKIFGEKAQAEIRFYDREGFGEDIEAYQKVSFQFDPERFAKDMEQLAKARAQVAAGGGRFLGTKARLSEPREGVGPSVEQLNEAMSIAQEIYDNARTYGSKARFTASRTMHREDDDMKAAPGMRERAAGRAKKKVYDDLDPRNFERYLNPPPIAAGGSTRDLLTNLATLQDQSKLFQRMQGLDEETLKKMPKEIKAGIDAVSEEGPGYQSFIDTTNKLKEIYESAGSKGLGGKQFSGKDLIDAWKLYRIAVGDYYLKLAEGSYEEIKQAEAASDPRAGAEAYGKFESGTKRLQEFVRRSLGKRTDPYTTDKRFPYPGLAQAAGVYMDPKQIMQKAGEPLGDDPKLIAAFQEIIKGIDKQVGKTAPVTAARRVFRDLSDPESKAKDLMGTRNEMIKLLADGEKFKRMGEGVVEAWDFDKLVSRTTRLRTALQQVLRENKEMDAEQRKNLENLVKYLKNVESMYSHMSLGGPQTGYGQTGIVPVPKFESPETQKALHARNIQSVREYFKRAQEAGGPEIGESFSYQEKIIGAAGETIKNVTHHFKKYGEVLLETGDKVGKFSESHQDIIEKMQKVGASFSSAIRRVVMWGAASRLVYGGISSLKSSLDELANIEVGVAQLRMVMSPLETDFDKMSKAAAGLGKQYGVPVTDVLKSMKVFAQQGLKQGDVIDRTQTATLASNVTTLNAKEATEALTAAMRVFREEGTQSLRFLDAWSEVEAKHAITADDMANAIKKSAAAAKSAGVSFDELNGMVAAVGAVTRQTGKEVGTSFRFIFRRLFSEKGPKELAKLNIPTLTNEGELRGAYDVLGDLAGKWDDLSSAQRMNIAQAVGGTRQYNSLLVLMDQWDEALRGVRNSTNSKGSAERRNAEIMKTYAKQLQRTKAAATEFKMEIGKVALPIFTAGSKALTFMFETLTAIPAPIKVATAALATFFTLGAKGIDIFDSIGGGIDKGGALFGNLADEFKKQMKIAKYEVTGKADVTTDIFGLKTLTPFATKTANALKGTGDQLAQQGTQVTDFHSTLGQMMFQFMNWGKSYNEMIGGMLTGTGTLTEKVADAGKGVGGFLSFAAGGTAGLGGLKDALQGGAAKRGLGGAAVKKTLTTEGLLKGGGKILSKAAGLATEIAGASTYIVSQGIDAVGEQIGAGGQKILKDFASQNTGFVKSVAPLALTIAAMVPALKAGAKYMKTMAGSAQDYEKSMDGARRQHESQVKAVRDMVQEYDALAKKVKDIEKVQDPGVKARRQQLGTYEAPLTTLQDVQKRAIDLSNSLANSNVDLVAGYDKLGNAILRTTDGYKNYLKEVERVGMKASAQTELDILGRYTEDLTSGNQTEKIKKAFKELLEAVPVLGGLAARGIKVSPMTALEEASKDLNKQLNKKQKFPMSTAADEDIKRLQKVLGKARSAFTDTFSDLQKTYNKVLSPANLKGLSGADIDALVRSPELQKARELIIELDPKFKLIKAIPTGKGRDKDIDAFFEKWAKENAANTLLGRDLLTAANPQVGGLLDYNAKLTKANLESAGLTGRQGKTFSGDILTFYDDFADKHNIAGAQAIVKMKDTDEWIIEYFNSRTLQIEERPLSEVEKMVDGIFPLQKVKEDLSYRMDSLNTFVAGAAAGLSGISAKDFKKDFNLGERFFGEIPTTTLLQGSKGFQPGKGYGNVEAMKGFRSDIEEYFFKPMEELRRKTEQFKKLQLEGLEGEDVNISKGFYEEISKLLNVLKNNQVVLQFRAVFVDLMKEISSGQRLLKEEIATMRQRSRLNVAAGGLTAGMPIDLENIDLGVRKASDLTAQQRLLTGDKGFREGAVRLRELEMAGQSNLEMVDKFERALVQIDDIMNVAQGFGAALTPDQLGEYVEQVAPERGQGPFYELKQIDLGIEKNTAATVDKLEKLLENTGDPEAVERQLANILDNLGTGISNVGGQKTVNALERVARVRDAAEGRGDQDTVVATNKAIDILTKQLVTQVGYSKGMEMVGDSFTLLKKRYTPEEFQQRAFGGIDSRVLMDKLKEAAPEVKARRFFATEKGRPALEESEVFKRFEKAQQTQIKQTTFSSKNLARVAAVTAALSKLQQSGNRKVIAKLDAQIDLLDKDITGKKGKGASEGELTELTNKRTALAAQRGEKQKQADFYGTVSALSATGFAATELAKSFGLTESQVNTVGIASAALYGSMVMASKVTGEELPESAKEFGNKLKEIGKSVVKGEKPSGRELRSLGKVGKEMSKDFAERTKQVFGDKAKDVGKTDMSERELEEYGKRLVRGLEKADAPSALKNIVVALTAITAADFVSNKLADKTAAAETTKLMEKQAEAFGDVLKQYPEIADKVLRDSYAQAKKSAKEVDKVETVDKSLVQDTEKAKKEIKKQIEELRDTYIKEQKKALEEQRKVQQDLANKRIRQEDRDVAYRSVVDEKNRRAAEAINRKYSLQNVIQKGLGGYGGDVSLPVPVEEMSTQQRIYAEAAKEADTFNSKIVKITRSFLGITPADTSFKAMIDAYADGPAKLDAMRRRMTDLSSRMTEEAETISVSGDGGEVDAAKSRYKKLAEELKKQTKAADEFAESLKKFGEAYVYLDRFTASMNQFQSALKEISTLQAVDWIPGMREAQQREDLMLGGPSPYSRQPVTVEEQRAGMRTGVPLEHLESRRMDIERARILDQLRDATGQQAVDLQQQLTDLPERYRREEMVREQQRFDEGLKRSKAPYKEQLTSLERVRTLPGLDEDVRTKVAEYQEKLGDALKHASDRMPIDDYLKELKADEKKIRSNLGDEAYETELKRVEKFKEDGFEKIYRGITPGTRVDLAEKPEEIKAALKEFATLSGEGLNLQANVSDPIINKLDETNAILKAIADKEFGLDFEKQGFFSKLFGREKYVDLSKYMKNAAGGFVSGPGTPTSDSIPAYLSDSEYVIKASSVQKLGVPALDHMNKTGQVPKFASGGFVSKASEGLGNFRKYLEEERLALAHKDEDLTFGSGFKQAGFAITELGTRLLEGATGLGAMVEQVAGYAGEHGIGATLGAGVDIGKGIGSSIATLFKTGITKEQVSAFAKSTKGELGKGGLGITAGLLELISGGGISKKIARLPKPQLKALTKGVAEEIVPSPKSFKRVIYHLNPHKISPVSDIGGGGVAKKMMSPPDSLKGQLEILAKSSNKEVSEKALDALNSEASKKLFKSKLLQDKVEYVASGAEAMVFKRKGRAIRLGKLKSPTSLQRVRDINPNLSEMSDDALLERFSAGLTKNEINEISVANEMLAHFKLKGKTVSISEFLDTKAIKKYDPVLDIRRKLEEQGAVPGNYGQSYFTKGKSGNYYKITDLHKGNFGLDAKGQLKGIDPGMYKKISAEKVPLDAQLEFNKRASKGSKKIKNIPEQAHVPDNVFDPVPSYTADSPPPLGYEDWAIQFAEGGPVGGAREKKRRALLEREWALKTLKETDEGILAARRGRGKFDSDDPFASASFMGVGEKDGKAARYDTEQFREALEKKKVFAKDAAARKVLIKRSEGKKRRTQAREAGLANILGYEREGKEYGAIKADYKVLNLDAQRQLVRLDDDPTSYQSKYELNLHKYDKDKLSYVKDFVKKYHKGYTTFKDDPGYMYAKNIRQEERKKLMDNLYDVEADVDYNAYPGYLGKLKKSYDNTMKTLDVESITEEEKKMMNQRADRLYGVMEKIVAGEDIYGKKVQTLSRLALYGGKLEEGAELDPRSKVLFDKEGYGGRAKLILKRGRKAYYDELLGMKNAASAFHGDPRLFMEFFNKAESGELSESEAEKYRKKLKKFVVGGGKYEKTAHVGTVPSKKIDQPGFAPTGPASRVTPGPMDFITSLFSEKKSAADELEAQTKSGMAALLPKLDDFFASLFNRSAPAMHNGGMVQKTGMVFAEGGEVILPKKLKAGGAAFGANTMSLSETSIKLDASDLLSKLSDIELKVEEATVSVDVGDVKVPVDTPTEAVKVEVDATTAALAIETAAKSAANDIAIAVGKIDLSGAGTNAVGGEKFDQLAQTVKGLEDRIIVVKSEVDGKMRMLGEGNNETTDIDRRVVSIVDTKISGMKQDIDDIRDMSANTSSKQRQKDVYYETKISELDYRLNNAMNVTGIGTGGVLI